ncbi:shikimate dehydrogenase family protein [Pararhizobium haloflavum]|uniref:shikimate dehydrogenase family protein n=1 Tax=Pararhizobium haloflavum TaxID=2037914 RepID=UPI000C18E89A|nr:shikimate dehydrogenase [Pararhizobium haloflavum]
MAAIRLGLIGDNIARSRSPRLHELAGALAGQDVSYERLIPSDIGQDFESTFDFCMREGFRGINVTYPYKERVVRKLTVADPVIAAIGACNTVLFESEGPQGHNTDYTGFVHAFRSALGDMSPGIVAMAGAGGVGKAIGFALADLGCERLLLYDLDEAKAEALRASLQPSGMTVAIADSIDAACQPADGLINCTPIGMVGYPGSAMPAPLLGGKRWAFDAVYTPVDTQFLIEAETAGLRTLSGYELFFHQGVDAFRLFTGLDVDEAALRDALEATDPNLKQTA